MNDDLIGPAQIINHQSSSIDAVIPFLSSADPFPPVDSALRAPNGLLAAGGDLSPERLLEAYAEGIFPWFGEDDPILWWSPDPRMVLYVRDVHVSRSLRKTLNGNRFRVTLDTAFPAVVRACAEARRDHEGTWITPEMEAAYLRLFELGHAHSVETWHGDVLAGGLYGVAVGRMFFGESMFTRVTDASKVALVHLARQLEKWEMPLIDCQMTTPHLASLGARDIARTVFVDEVRYLVRKPAVASPWALDL
jgi:leucyl/phenylalanyl-tRNA--protein transferase